MALIVGTNSWVTILEADDYLENYVKATDWFALPDTIVTSAGESKENYLVAAYRMIMANLTFEVPSDSTDPSVKAAQIQFALLLLRNIEEYQLRMDMIASGIKSYKFSEHSEDLSTDFGLPYSVKSLLANYYTGSGIVLFSGEDYT